MTLERQTSWGNLVALAMFLGGVVAGVYVAGFILKLIGDLKWLAITGMVLGPILWQCLVGKHTPFPTKSNKKFFTWYIVNDTFSLYIFWELMWKLHFKVKLLTIPIKKALNDA